MRRSFDTRNRKELKSGFPARLGFTLVELFVVIAIIGGLVGLLLPAVQAARATARRITCQNKMRQIGIAIHNYHCQYDQFPPSKWYSGATPLYFADQYTPRNPRHNILSFLLPFLEQNAIYDRFRFRYHWFYSENKSAYENHIPLFYCPDAPALERIWLESVGPDRGYVDVMYHISDYAACEQIRRTRDYVQYLLDQGIIRPRPADRELNGLLRPSWDRVVTQAMVEDGLSNTMMFFECGGRPGLYEGNRQFVAPNPAETGAKGPFGVSGARWADDEANVWVDMTCGPGKTQMFNCWNANEIYGFHVGGAVFLYGDGVVRFHPTSMNPETFVSLFTAFDGDFASFE